jgi:hypothetical protein
MTNIGSKIGALAVTFLVLLYAGAADAQASRTWVSGVGDDANPCSRTAPCKTFAGAISKTGPSGEINVLDPGGFGAVTITKAITIANDGVGTAGVIVVGTNGIVVQAGVSDVVTLRGLDIDGDGAAAGSLAGVQFNSGAALLIDHCKIYGFQASGGAGFGISFTPSGASKLWVTDTIISSNGSTGGAIGGSGNVLIEPKSGGSATAYFERVQLLNGMFYGLRADGVAGAGATYVALHQVVADGGANLGFTATTAATGGPLVSLFIDESTASNNVTFGVKSNGSNATIRLTRSTVTNNGTGLSAINSGVLASYVNNNVSGNVGGNDGSSTTTITPK